MTIVLTVDGDFWRTYLSLEGTGDEQHAEKHAVWGRVVAGGSRGYSC